MLAADAHSNCAYRAYQQRAITYAIIALLVVFM